MTLGRLAAAAKCQTTKHIFSVAKYLDALRHTRSLIRHRQSVLCGVCAGSSGLCVYLRDHCTVRPRNDAQSVSHQVLFYLLLHIASLSEYGEVYVCAAETFTGVGEHARRRSFADRGTAIGADFWAARELCSAWYQVARQVAHSEVVVSANRSNILRKVQALSWRQQRFPNVHFKFRMAEKLRLTGLASLLQNLDKYV